MMESIVTKKKILSSITFNVLLDTKSKLMSAFYKNDDKYRDSLFVMLSSFVIAACFLMNWDIYVNFINFFQHIL